MATRLRCVLSVNHDHDFGRKFQACEFRISGTKGAAYVKLGVNLDYPRGEPDELWIRPAGGEEWISVPLQGAWFPDAFANRMANLQRFATGEGRCPDRLRRRCLANHGSGRGRLSIQCAAGDGRLRLCRGLNRERTDHPFRRL